MNKQDRALAQALVEFLMEPTRHGDWHTKHAILAPYTRGVMTYFKYHEPRVTEAGFKLIAEYEDGEG